MFQAQVTRFCAENGSWESKLVPYTEWNLELLEPMTKTMSLWWKIHDKRAVDNLEELQTTILKSLDGLAIQVKGIIYLLMLANFCF